MASLHAPGLDGWVADLESRHLAELRFAEVSRALRALSSTYVERRHRLAEGAALEGRGKRAAFALYYGPLHFLLVEAIVRALPGTAPPLDTIVDLGCGTGAAGAAWACATTPQPRVTGIDRHPWAVAEAARTYRAFGLRARAVRGDAAHVRLPSARAGIVAAFTVNELGGADRAALLGRLLERAAAGARVLVVEPLAGAVAPWWSEWEAAVVAAGGRADTWRIEAPRPELVTRLARAAGLGGERLTGRSLWLGGR